MANQIVVCIPIHLKNRQEIATALVNKYGMDYLFMGRIFQATKNNESCTIDICDRNPSLAAAFEMAGQDKISASTLQEIDNHQQVIYLTSVDRGYQACRQLARFVRVLLDVGGIAVKVDSAGIAHPPDKWLANYDSDDVFDIYSLFVVLIEGEDSYYSCGMQNFDKADVAVSVAEDIGLAIYVMNVFNYYRLSESPILQDGHTFQPDIECPTYKIKWIPDRENEANSELCNSFGRWYLTND